MVRREKVTIFEPSGSSTRLCFWILVACRSISAQLLDHASGISGGFMKNFSICTLPEVECNPKTPPELLSAKFFCYVGVTVQSLQKPPFFSLHFAPASGERPSGSLPDASLTGVHLFDISFIYHTIWDSSKAISI
ncbi:uncharacterized protein ARMOST_11892 [Armillaria ostoyae]|uniref:Uncharacterized protein n=1 Tax=Armillaria ostoyae TaxID=47428 RepID=A0A284RIE6_ARMOS|nr:uncharacterized protein ARMOST_11892 [Armillaria ostoyae]